MSREPEPVSTANDAVASDITQTNLESNLNQLSVEALRFVCRGPEEPIEDVGVSGK
ncbi:9571_t:CDS:2, partial [Racocetra fulgida]